MIFCNDSLIFHWIYLPLYVTQGPSLLSYNNSTVERGITGYPIYVRVSFRVAPKQTVLTVRLRFTYPIIFSTCISIVGTFFLVSTP